MTDRTIPAATILLLRDVPQFEVLMIERHEDIGFAGGALVFPGGRIETADSNRAWDAHSAGLHEINEDQRAPRIAAIREAFEETGILFARRRGEKDFVGDECAQSLGAHRLEVEEDAQRFFDMIREENLELACDALHVYARWSPPSAALHRRYDTWFFAAKTPPGQVAREDGNEATEAIWISPAAAIEARATGERKMIFPTARNVELLGLNDSAGEVFKAAAERPIRKVTPSIVERPGGKFVTIPEDLGYPVTEEAFETALRT